VTRLLLAYAASMAMLTPLFALYLWIVPRRAGLRFQWALHRVLFALALLLPVALVPGWRVAAPAPVRAAVAAVQRVMLVTDAAPAAAPAQVPVAEPNRRPFSPLGLSWLIPAAGALAFTARLSRQKAREARWARAGTVRRIGRAEVVFSAGVPVPLSTGFLRPRVFLPSSLAGRPRQLQVILAHEGEHLRRRHWLWTILEALAAALLWPNPFLHLLARGGSRIRELLCDKAACRRFAPVEYGALLLDAAERGGGRELFLADAWVRHGFLRERVAHLVCGGRIVMKWNTRVVSVLAAVLFAAFLAAGVPFLAPADAQITSHGLFPLTHTWKGAMPVKEAGSITVTAAIVVVFGGSVGVSAGPDYRMLYPDRQGPGALTLTTNASLDAATAPGFSGRVLLNSDHAGTVALATADAFVSSVSSSQDGTWTVTLLSDGYRIIYRHLGAAQVEEGDTVQEGAAVGTLAAGTRSDPGAFYLEYEVWAGDTMIFPIAAER
jgi:beta-lactamase regulating signal transducer with metallopeptidase domain